MPKFDQPFVLEFGVCLGHRVVADDELLGECPDAREEVAVLEDPCVDGVTDLLHDLQVDRDASGGVESEEHVCTRVVVQWGSVKVLFAATRAAARAAPRHPR